MGCAPSVPQDVDILPIKAHCRTAFARCSTADYADITGQVSERNLGPQPDADGHDVVLCYPLGGAVFGLELQARYEKMDSVSLWTLEHHLSAPSSPLHPPKTLSGAPVSQTPGREIKPVPEDAGAAASSPPHQLLSKEVRLCRRGVVVLVTAGSTWDDGVLTCLRLTARYLRPLVMVHCVQSCPLPGLEEWPPDVRPLIAASGPPVKYLSQHSAEALRDVEQRMLAAAAAAATAGAPIGAAAAPPVAVPNSHCGCSPQDSSPRQQGIKPTAVAPLPQPGRPVSLPPLPPSVTQSQLRLQLQGSQQGQQQQQQQQPLPPLQGVSSPSGHGTPASSPECCRPGPLSLAALRASGSDICKRASQLLVPWPAHGSFRQSSLGGGSGGGAGGGTGALSSVSSASRSESPITTTLVEPIMPSSTRGSRAASSPVSGSGRSASQRAAIRLDPDSSGRGSRQVLHPVQRASGGGSVGGGGAADAVAGGSAGGKAPGSSSTSTTSAAGDAVVRCVLRYRDKCWAMPVAFVCAQLEQELGRSNVSLQLAAAAAASNTAKVVAYVTLPARSSSTSQCCVPGRSSNGAPPPHLAKSSPNPTDSWAARPSQLRRTHSHQPAQQQTPLHAGSMPLEAVIAAAASSLQGPRSCSRDSSNRSRGSSGADGDCACSCRPEARAMSTASSVSAAAPCRCTCSSACACAAGSNACSSRNEGRASTSVDDELMAFTQDEGLGSGADECSCPCTAAAAVSGSVVVIAGGLRTTGAGSGGGGGSSRRASGVIAAAAARCSGSGGSYGGSGNIPVGGATCQQQQHPPPRAVRTNSWAAQDMVAAPPSPQAQRHGAGGVAGGEGGGCADAAAGVTATAGTAAVGPTTCVYFVTPGLSVPAGCLEEVVAGLATGRRMVLVVDGGCCQRLPDFAPPGLMSETWKAMKKLWQDRLLYVPDYHSSFCNLLKQEVTTAAGTTAGVGATAGTTAPAR